MRTARKIIQQIKVSAREKQKASERVKALEYDAGNTSSHGKRGFSSKVTGVNLKSVGGYSLFRSAANYLSLQLDLGDPRLL